MEGYQKREQEVEFLDYRESIRRVIDFIEENLCNTLTVEQLAAVAGYSKYHFVRIFVEETGFTPADYIRKRRLSVIAEKLDEHTGSIAELAFAYGFNSKENFVRAFKAEHRVLPTEYRRTGNSLRLYPRFTKETWTDGADAGAKEGNLREGTGPEKAGLREAAALAGENFQKDDKVGGMGRRKDAPERKGGMPEPEFRMLSPFSLTVYESDEAFPPHFWNKYNCGGFSLRLSGGKTVTDYGVSDWDVRTNTLRYLIGIRTEDARGDTAGTKTISVNGGMYAVFATKSANHFDFVDTIQNTWKYINTVWLPNSGYVRTGGYEFETYVEKSRQYSEEIYIPVQ